MRNTIKSYYPEPKIRFFRLGLGFACCCERHLGIAPPLFSVGVLSVRPPICPGDSVSYCNDTTAGTSRCMQPTQFLRPTSR